MDPNKSPPAEAATEYHEEIITEDILIERAKLSNSELSRCSKSSSSSECSFKQQLPLNEDVLITNAVLVKCESTKTTSTATLDTDTTEESTEDEVFDNKEENRKTEGKANNDTIEKPNLVDDTFEHKHDNVKNKEAPAGSKIFSEVKNNNIPDIQVTDVDEPTAELRDELKDKLPEGPSTDVPRLNFEGMDDYPSGCMTPVNSEDETVNNPQVVESLETEKDTEQEDLNSGAAMEIEENNDQQNIKETVIDEVEVGEESRTRDTKDDEPLDYDFNELVIDIANAICGHEFKTIKTTLKGLDCMSEYGLISLSTPLTYLNHLRRCSLISRDNLAHLQTIVCLLNKPDLHKKAMQYTEHKFDVVFFYPAKDNIPPSYETVKCHVKERDFTRLKRGELESIRTGIANQLFIPAQFVYIVGIEPGFSVIVSVMLHQRYIGAFEEVLDGSMSQMYKLGVDAVQIRGKTYTIGDTGITTEEESDYSSSAFLSVFHQLKENNKQLAEKDEEIFLLSQETEFMQLELDTMSAELELLTERALRESVTSRKQPKQERITKRHGRSLSEPNREIPNRVQDNTPCFWDFWVKPTVTSGYDVDRSLRDLAETVGNGNSEAGLTDLDISTADHKDKDTLMQEIEGLLKELGAKEL